MMNLFWNDDAAAAGPGACPPGADMVVAEAGILGNELVPGDRLPNEARLSLSRDVSRDAAREIRRMVAAMPIIGTRRPPSCPGTTRPCSSLAPSDARGTCRAGRWTTDRARSPSDLGGKHGLGRVAPPRTAATEMAEVGGMPVATQDRAGTTVPAVLGPNFPARARAGERPRQMPHQASRSRDRAAESEGRDGRATAEAGTRSSNARWPHAYRYPTSVRREVRAVTDNPKGRGE